MGSKPLAAIFVYFIYAVSCASSFVQLKCFGGAPGNVTCPTCVVQGNPGSQPQMPCSEACVQSGLIYDSCAPGTSTAPPVCLCKDGPPTTTEPERPTSSPPTNSIVYYRKPVPYKNLMKHMDNRPRVAENDDTAETPHPDPITIPPPAEQPLISTNQPNTTPNTGHPISTEQTVTGEPQVSTENSIPTVQPVTEVHPVSTGSPVATEQPVTDKLPITDNRPVTTEQPVTNKRHVTTEQPVTDKHPVTIQTLATTEQPVTDKQSVTIQIPVTTEKPVTEKPPATTQSPAATEPILITGTESPVFSTMEPSEGFRAEMERAHSHAAHAHARMTQRSYPEPSWLDGRPQFHRQMFFPNNFGSYWRQHVGFHRFPVNPIGQEFRLA